jgi:site-specific DNA recombinase
VNTTTSSTNPRAAVYCRISQDAEATGLGVERQRKACRRLATQRGYEIVETYTDNDLSAYDGRKPRPGFEAMLDAAKGGRLDVILAYHPDRLTRRAVELERFIDVLQVTGVNVETAAAGVYDLATASGQVMARTLGAFAQYESQRLGERARMKSDERAEKGLPPGGRVPFGYRWEHPDLPRHKGRWLVDDDEAGVVRWIADRILDGASVLRVSRELNARGVKTKEGRDWHHSSVRATVLNPAVAGLRVHRGEPAGPAAWEPIIDRARWEQLRATLADPARKRTRPARRYLLTGLVETETGDRLRGRSDRKIAPTYATDQGAATHVAIGAEALESFVTEAALVALSDVDLAAVVAVPADAAAHEVAEIEAELLELAKARGDRKITMAEWLAAKAPLDAALEDARRRSVAPRRPPQLAAARDLRAAWGEASVDDRRAVLATVIERVVVKRADRGRWTPIAERVEIRWKV